MPARDKHAVNIMQIIFQSFHVVTAKIQQPSHSTVRKVVESLGFWGSCEAQKNLCYIKSDAFLPGDVGTTELGMPSYLLAFTVMAFDATAIQLLAKKCFRVTIFI